MRLLSPDGKSQMSKPFEQGCIDVPAAKVIARQAATACTMGGTGKTGVPLVVPLEQRYTSNGNCVVSNSTAVAVGHNGWTFRAKRGTAELSSLSITITRQAWPPQY